MASSASIVLFAGGGTGGHLYPSLAVAERLAEMSPAVSSRFACSDRPVDHAILEEAGVAFDGLSVRPIPTSPVKVPGFLWHFRKASREAARLIDAHGVGAVVAMGGFVCGPVVAAARRRRVPVFLVNLDAVPGRANRWAARRADQIFTVYPSKLLPDAKAIAMPLRHRSLGSGDPAADRAALGLDPDRPVFLVTGASQGATSINALMLDLIRRIPVRRALDGWQVLHLTGEGADRVELEKAYAKAEVPVRVMAYCHAMGRAWGGADLAISRAGAGSVAEAVANHVPTLFLPYPYHKDQHQRFNAQPLVDAGGAVMRDDAVDPKVNAAKHLALILELLADAPRRGVMRQALATLDRADGAVALAQALRAAL